MARKSGAHNLVELQPWVLLLVLLKYNDWMNNEESQT
jgi:hypothetical protein